MAAATHAQEKPKAKERRFTKKNVKRVCEELDTIDVDKLLQDVLNVCSYLLQQPMDTLCLANTLFVAAQ